MTARRKLKVYGWVGHRAAAPTRHKQTREIVAATSQKAAALAAGYDRPSRLWNLGETGNQGEIEKAMSHPGKVFWRPLDARDAEWTAEETKP